MLCNEEVRYGREAAAGEVVRRADYLLGQLASFRRRVERAKRLIEKAALAGPIGVAFSGGKDSTVLLHLVRSIVPEAPAAFFDDGAQLGDTYEFIAATANVTVIAARPSLLEMCRQGGYWGHPTSTPDLEFNFGQHLIQEPSAEFVQRFNLETVAIGLRADESTGRHFNALRKGEFYFCQEDGTWHLCPLAFWSVDDIWAYLATFQVPYNPAYDKMAALGLKREEMRIAPVLGAAAVGFGRYAYLKRLDPGLWNRLVAEFPKLAIYV